MRQVALISQPLRATYCQSFLDMAPGDSTVMTSDVSAFDEIEFSSTPTILAVTPPSGLLPSKRLTRGRLYRSALSRARAGSKLGRWLERTAKRMAWRLRYLDRITLLIRSGNKESGGVDSLRSSLMYEELGKMHQTLSLDRIVIFDLFDLPVALRFGDDYDVEVIVR